MTEPISFMEFAAYLVVTYFFWEYVRKKGKI